MRRIRRRLGLDPPRPKTVEVDFFANRMNYADHLLPIYKAMPSVNRGYFVVGNTENRRSMIDQLLAYCKSKGVEAIGYRDHKRVTHASPRWVVMAGLAFVDWWRGHHLVLVNHGCGGHWNLNHQSYAGGGAMRQLYKLILDPGDIPGDRDKHSCPRSKVVVVGCPKMDRWYPVQPKELGDPPVIAIGFHQDTRVCPESRTALPHYMTAFPQLAAWQESGEVKIIGTGHPVYWDTLLPLWKKYGFEPVLDFDEVMKRADVYVRDQYSTIYEFASLDRPVVLLNAPWYRRNVEHGMRFWELSNVGINCDNPEDLIDCIKLALTDPDHVKQARRNAVDRVYKYMDGKSTERAVGAIIELIHEKPKRAMSEIYPDWR